MQPIKVYDSIVSMDYGQFSLYGRQLYENEPYPDPVLLIEKAHSEDSIASNALEILILSPHQNNFEMPLRVELWNNLPPDDMDNWQEVFEANITVEGNKFYFRSADGNEHVFNIPDNRYKMLITGRGFVQPGWPGSTTPGDHWRIQLWPSEEPAVYRRLKKWVYQGETSTQKASPSNKRV